MNEYRPMRPECKEELRKLHERIDKRGEEIKDIQDNLHNNEIEITKVSEDVLHIAKSINGLTKALWGVAASTMATMFGFLIWYIQQL